MPQRGVLRCIEETHVSFHCPGCDSPHVLRLVRSGSAPCWSFDGNYERPTFNPSVFSNPPGPHHVPSIPTCHSWVRDGKIQFLTDSTHALAGKTVDLEAR